MTGKEFLNAVANGREDVVQALLDILAETGSNYCVIGGLAVNAYVEPVVSLDVDVVVAAKAIDAVSAAAAKRGFKVERSAHGVDLTHPGSDLRVQIQTDPRYEAFIPRGVERDVLGYRIKVAALEDVVQGKVWAYTDPTRRPSKRQKDLADLLRLIEAHPDLAAALPAAVRDALDRA